MRVHTISSRPHVQGNAAPVRLRHSAGNLSDGAGLLLVRRLWDAWGVGRQLDTNASWLAGVYRPSLMVEVWVVLLLYGGGCMDDLALLAGRGVRRHLRMDEDSGPDDLRPLAQARRAADGRRARRRALAGGARALGRGGHPEVRHARAGQHRGSALRAETGGSREGLQSEEAGSAQPSPAGRLPGGS